MKTPDEYQSENVDDRRDGNSSSSLGGLSGSSMTALAPLIMTLFKSKKGRVIAIILIVVMLFGGSKFSGMLGGVTGSDSPFSQMENQYSGFDTPSNNNLENGDAPKDSRLSFVSFVLDDTNTFWEETFNNANETYTPSRLVVFDGQVSSACGISGSEVGPFYCPGDDGTYLDLSFFDDLATRFGSSGDFAQAYVIAHEIGHHVQNELGITKQARQLVKDSDATDNEVSVRVELQADCFAGVWAHSANQRGLLDVGDIDEAIDAASGIGDDAIMKQSGMNVDQEAFTHGSSAQRRKWLKKGFDSGDSASCDTFKNDI